METNRYLKSKMYLYLSSDGSPVFNATNKWYDFRCTLHEPLQLDARLEWHVSILELYIQDKISKNYDEDLIFFIKSDLADVSYVNLEKEPVLGDCRMKECFQSVKNFNSMFSVPVVRHDVHTVHIYISTSGGRLPALDQSAVTRITLSISSV